MTKKDIKFLKKTLLERNIKDKKEWQKAKAILKFVYDELIQLGYEIPLMSNADEIIINTAEKHLNEKEKAENKILNNLKKFIGFEFRACDVVSAFESEEIEVIIEETNKENYTFIARLNVPEAVEYLIKVDMNNVITKIKTHTESEEKSYDDKLKKLKLKIMEKNLDLIIERANKIKDFPNLDEFEEVEAILKSINKLGGIRRWEKEI